ncbi:MAG: flagellar protein FliT [Selenomonadaceae bacterium]|nr:flagellar protein FliT [Selenomonadaceae bacterium]
MAEQYLVLTEELLKFIDKQDVDTFMEIVPQRDVLLERLQALGEPKFRRTEEGRAIVDKVKSLDMQIIYKARSWLNKSRHQNAAVRSYDLGSMAPVGNILNRKY